MGFEGCREGLRHQSTSDILPLHPRLSRFDLLPTSFFERLGLCLGSGFNPVSVLFCMIFCIRLSISSVS